MPSSQPFTNLVTYVPKPGCFDALEALVIKHGPALKASGLITDEPIRMWKATNKHGEGPPYFVETFQWKDREGPNLAMQSPEIMSVWEPMGEILEELTIATLEPIVGS